MEMICICWSINCVVIVNGKPLSVCTLLRLRAAPPDQWVSLGKSWRGVTRDGAARQAQQARRAASSTASLNPLTHKNWTPAGDDAPPVSMSLSGLGWVDDSRGTTSLALAGDTPSSHD